MKTDKVEAATVWIEGEGWKPALLFPGRAHVRAVIITPKVVVRRIPLDDIRTPLKGTVSKIASQFRGVARRHGSTKEARRLLATVKS